MKKEKESEKEKETEKEKKRRKAGPVSEPLHAMIMICQLMAR